MTESVKDLIEVGFKYYSLNRIEIRCAVENRKSRAIPERLG
jgi:ribosomal-protein-serine acetyltransferase